MDRLYFGNTREPFAITVAGQTLYVLTSPPDVQAFFKNTTSLSWIHFVRDIYRWIGISPTNIVSMWRLPTDEQKKANPKRMLPPNQMIEEYHSQQLLPGGQLSTTSTIFVNYINDRVRWQSQAFHQDRPFILEASPSSITVDVLGWTTFTFVHALTEIYYGPSLLASAPELLESFQDWEKTNWKFMFQTPGIMSKDMSVAKGQLIDAFTTYFKKPIEQRMGANHFVSSTENELRICGLDDNELAKINMLHHWA